MSKELELSLEEIGEKDCQSAFEHDILQTYELLANDDGNLSEDEKLLIEALIKLNRAWMITASASVKASLLKLWIEATELSCNEEIPIILSEEHYEILAGSQWGNGKKSSAINWLFANSWIRKTFWWNKQKQAFWDFYSEILTLKYAEDNFMFKLTDAQVKLAHDFLRENGIIWKYDKNVRRDNYILWIVTYQLDWSWINIDSKVQYNNPYKENLKSRVYWYLDNFDKQWLYPRINSFEEANSLIEEWYFIQIQWLKYDAGTIKNAQKEWQWALLYAHPSVQAIVTEVLKRIWNRWLNRLLESESLLRPVTYNEKVWWSNKSPHVRWLGFDFTGGSREWYEIPILEWILKDLDEQWYIVLTIESDHYHISVIDPEKTLKDFPITLNWEPQIIQQEEKVEITREFLDTTRLWIDVIQQLWDEAWKLFIDYFWLKIEENPEKYIDPEWRVLWTQKFLNPFFKSFSDSLNEKQKELFLWKELLLRIFYIRKQKKRSSQRTLFFDYYLNPRNINQQDNFTRNLAENTQFPEDFKNFLWSVVRDTIFRGSPEIFDENKDIIARNLEVFIAFVIDTESNFQNIPNQWPLWLRSSAKWLAQYLSWDVNGIVNTSYFKSPANTSFGVWIRRTQRVLSQAWDWKIHETISSQFDEIKELSDDSFLFTPLNLTWQNQVMLLVGDQIWMAMNVAWVDPEERQYLYKRALLFGDRNAMIQIYSLYHHTDPNHTATQRLAKNEMKKYGDKVEENTQIVWVEKSRLELWYQLEALIWNPKRSETWKKLQWKSWIRVEILQRMLLFLWYKVANLKIDWNMVSNFWWGTKSALIQFQIDNLDSIKTENSKSAWLFWPWTKEALAKKVEEAFNAILEIDDNFIWPPLAPGLRKSDMLAIFSR